MGKRHKKKTSNDTRLDVSPFRRGGLSAPVAVSAPTAAASTWPIVQHWSPLHSYILLIVLTCACLLPFSGRAFHIDDTLFVWAGQHIAHKPLDPFGFKVNWDQVELPMFQVTKNPPLTCYYIAMIGSIAGWSERILHLSFLIWPLIVVLGTYLLARRFTEFPLVAALATLLTPALLVSASSVMCDTMMLALWMLAVILWLEGLDPIKPHYLLLAGLFIGAAALTKYFGAALIPLLFVYSFRKQKRLSPALLFLLLPIAILLVYQLWTRSLYGRGLVLDAAQFASEHREEGRAPFFGSALVVISFVGGCMLPGITLAPFVWRGKQILLTGILSAAVGLAVIFGVVNSGPGVVGADLLRSAMEDHWLLLSLEFAFCFAAGISILAASITDFWRNRDADTQLLFLWVLGTAVFAGYLNWTINARSVLPLVPAAGILLARRLSLCVPASAQTTVRKSFVPLLASGILALWITIADTQLANSARAAAGILHRYQDQTRRDMLFEGHWGFQYYMQLYGAHPVDVKNFQFKPGDIFVVAENNSGVIPLKPEFIAGGRGTEIELDGPKGATTASWKLGAGFYSSHWGPLPFAIGDVPPERYLVYALTNPPPETVQLKD